MRRAFLAVGLLTGLVLAGGFAAARSTPDLAASGPTSVTGTEATAVFEVGDRTVRQVRYDDGGTLTYTFRVVNRGRLPLTLLGLLQYLTPAAQFLIGVLIFDEDMPPERLVGFVLIWGALVLLSIDGVRSFRTPTEPLEPAL